jgi:hypothetical protein
MSRNGGNKDPVMRKTGMAKYDMNATWDSGSMDASTPAPTKNHGPDIPRFVVHRDP